MAKKPMNDAILKLVQALSETDECINSEYTLTVNYNRIIQDEFETSDYVNESGDIITRYGKLIPTIFTKESVEEIKNKLNFPAENFNLTLNFNNGVNNDDMIYDIGWYHFQLIFHGSNTRTPAISVTFDMGCEFATLHSYDVKGRLGEIKVPEEKISETINYMINLKNILIENQVRIIKQLSKIKKLKK